MRYVLFGRSGLRVSELCLGTMTFGEEWGWGASKEECRRQFDVFVERGGNFIDTANHYTNGTAERLVGEFVKGSRDRFVLATKYTLGQPGTDPNAAGNHRKSLRCALDASLQRLGTDYVDLYWVHAWDGLTPLDELMRALDDAVTAGKVLHVGFSDAPAWVVARANTLADLHGWTPFTGIQVQYSLVERTVERELLPMARAMGLAVAAWSPLAGGLLTGKYAKGKANGPARLNNEDNSFGWLTERNQFIAAEVGRIAGQMGRTPAQVALAWVRQQGADVVPILGARTSVQLVDGLGALDVVFTDEHRRRLEKASAVDLGFPAQFLNETFVRGVVHGGMHEKLDVPVGYRA